MVRPLTSNTLTSSNQPLGTEPILIVKIEWGSGTVYYADKTIGVGSISAKGAILSASDILDSGKQDTIGTISSMSLTLDDTDGTLNTIVKHDIIEGVLATVYHHYVGNTEADLTIMLRGKIAGDIQWSEGERLLSFDIETAIEDGITGCNITEGSIPNLTKDAIDKTIPLAFGTVLNVPAIRVLKQPKGKLKSSINQNFTTFEVTGGADFPQTPTVITISIGNLLFTGTMQGETFTVQTANVPKNTNVALTNRLTTDPDKDNPAVAWIADPTINLSLQYCYIIHPTEGVMINFCESQTGQKCVFQKDWQAGVKDAGVLLDNTNTILETSAVPRLSWGKPYEQIFSSFIPAGLWYNAFRVDAAARIVSGGSWSIFADVDVLLSVNYSDTYVANCIGSVEVLRVSAFRRFTKKRLLMAVPKDYYNIVLTGTLGTISNLLYLTFPTSLRDRPDEEWEEDIYVSFRSTQGSNTADIIKYLVDTFSTLSTDNTSFNTVRSQVANFPANFALFDQHNVLDLIQGIAWQSRCVLSIKNGVVFILYLSVIPTSVTTFNPSNVGLKSLSLGYIRSEEIFTSIDAEWQPEYSATTKEVFKYRNNISLYGTRTRKFGMFIYNIKSLVQLSTAFWGYRLSNSWRTAKFNTFLNALALESFDAITLDLTVLSTNQVTGLLDNVSHDTDADTFSIETTLTVQAGGGGEPSNDVNFFNGDPNFQIPGFVAPPDVGSGIVEGNQLPTAGNSNPNSPPEDAGTGSQGGTILQLVITAYATQVQRTVGYTVIVESQNSAGIRTALPNTPTIALSISGDANDTILYTPQSLIGGQAIFTGVTIAGGSGQDSTELTATASLPQTYLAGIFNFTVIDLQILTLTWTATPPSITRATDFSATLQGGDPGMLIQLSSTTENLTPTTVNLDGAGNATIPNLQISGGMGSSQIALIAHDQTLKYADAISALIPVVGISRQIVKQTLTMMQKVTSKTKFLEIMQGGILKDNMPFSLTVTVKLSNGTTDTSFNGTVRVSAVDASGVVRNFASVGPDATTYGGYFLAGVTNGVWTFAGTTMNLLSATSPVTFNAIEFQGTINGTLDVPISAPPTLEMFFRPQVFRGTDIHLVLIATLDGKQIDTGFAEDVTLTLNNADPLDTLTETFIPASDWNGGIISLQNILILPSAATGKYLATLTATTATRFAIRNAYIAFNVGGMSGSPFFSQQSYSVQVNYNGMPILEANDLGSFIQNQTDTLAAFDAESTLNPTALQVAERSLFDNFNYFDLQSRTVGGYIARDIEPAQQSGASSVMLSLSLRIFLRDSILPDQYLTTFLSQPYTLKIKYNFIDPGDPFMFANGLEVRNMVPDREIPFSFVTALRNEQLGMPTFLVLTHIEETFPEFLTTPKSRVRTWFYIDGPPFNYAYPFNGILGEFIGMKIETPGLGFIR